MSINKKRFNKSSKDNDENIFRRKRLVLLLMFFLIAVPAILIVTKNMSKNEEEKKIKNNYKRSSIEFKVQGEVSFLDENNNFLSKIDIEIADNDEKRETGLMYRSNLKQNQGMMFIFKEQQLQSFWMRNTVLSLDIIFVDIDNRIVKIHHNTQPFLEESYPSLKPSIYVVEVNAGYCDRNSITEGDKIIWRRF